MIKWLIITVGILVGIFALIVISGMIRFAVLKISVEREIIKREKEKLENEQLLQEERNSPKTR